MQHRILSRSTLLLIVAASALACASAARAQMTGDYAPGGIWRNGAPEPDAKSAQPPALPGATSRSDAIAPAARIPADMSPNDALFDAINRGDIAVARDALNRGAELNAHNLLGMTPLELSVDLGRNDISFLLMSYRNSDTPNGPPTQIAATAAKPATPVKPAVATRTAHPPVVAVKAVVPPAPPQTPRLFADDGGTPVPGDGFLGFNVGHPTH